MKRQHCIRSTCFAVVFLLFQTTSLAVPLEDAVIYEVNLRAFSPSGNLDGVAARLDEIDKLGANVLWLMPIHPNGQIRKVGPLGSPYSVKDYAAVGSEYGSLQDLTELVDAAHERGMSVMMDWVANHTAWDHAWVSQHPDWYTQNGQGQIIHPPGTNWTDVADLNYNSNAMRTAMIGEMQHWVQNVGIDGFRVDAADFVPFDFWQQAISTVRGASTRPLLMLAEGARADHYTAGFDVTYDWDLYNATKAVFNSAAPASSLIATHNSSMIGIPSGKTLLRYTTNHDESAYDATPVELFGSAEASLAAYAATAAFGGTPLVYAGQEIGWEDNVPFVSKSPLDWSTGEGVLEWYTDFLQLRANRPAMRVGAVTDASSSDVVLVQRRFGSERVIFAVNTRNSVRSATVPTAWQGKWFDQFSGSQQQLQTSFSLQPFEVRILSNARPPIYNPYNGDSFRIGADGATGEYNAGSLLNQDQRITGWLGPWVNGTGGKHFEVVANGLTFSDMQVGGGAVQIGPNLSGRVHRQLSNPLDDTTNRTVYVSFLVRASGTFDGQNSTYGGLEFYDGNGLEQTANRQFQIVVGEDLGGGPTANFSAVLFNSDEPQLTADLGPNNGNVNMFVAKFEFHAGAQTDSVSLWRNPDLANEPLTSDFHAAGLDLNIAALSLARFGNLGTLSFDELRMGSTYLSVISNFEPATPGDTDGDGAVELEEDFGPIRDNWLETDQTFFAAHGRELLRIDGDLNLDGVIDVIDVREWKGMFDGSEAEVATAIGSLGANNIPEPNGLALVALAASGVALYRGLLDLPRREQAPNSAICNPEPRPPTQGQR